MKLIPDLRKLAQKSTNNWTKWDSVIYGYEELRIPNGRKGAVLTTINAHNIYFKGAVLTTINAHNIYFTKINDDYIIEMMDNIVKIFPIFKPYESCVKAIMEFNINE